MLSRWRKEYREGKLQGDNQTRAAMQYALKKRNYPKGIMFHTDWGIEYAGGEFQKLLNQYEFKHRLHLTHFR